jgi:hypothetical protein
MVFAMKRSKYSFTLLEVTLGIFLTGVLLSALWNLYHRWYRCYFEIQKAQQQTNESLLFHHRLDRLFTLFRSFEQEGTQPNFLYTPSEKTNGLATLYLSYENEADPNPDFNLSISSLLYLNGAKELCLVTWGENQQIRNEVLLDHVQSYVFAFFDPDTMDWRDNWPDTLDHDPIWLRITVQRSSSQPEAFTFRLMQSQEPILYQENE